MHVKIINILVIGEKEINFEDMEEKEREEVVNKLNARFLDHLHYKRIEDTEDRTA